MAPLWNAVHLLSSSLILFLAGPKNECECPYPWILGLQDSCSLSVIGYRRSYDRFSRRSSPWSCLLRRMFKGRTCREPFFIPCLLSLLQLFGGRSVVLTTPFLPHLHSLVRLLPPLISPLSSPLKSTTLPPSFAHLFPLLL